MFHSGTILEAYLKNSLRFTEVYFFTFYQDFTPFYKAYFHRKRKTKIFEFKNVMERRIRKTLSFVKHAIVSKIFGKITPKTCNFKKSQVPLG